jgi:hypothetical protein
VGHLRDVKRHGWTLHEMLVSMGITGIVLGLVSHAATGQLRFFRSVADAVAVKGQSRSASEIIASALWDASPAAGDLVVAQDSAIELRASIGSAIACASTPGSVTVSAPAVTGGNALSAFFELPDAGDRLAVLFADSLAATWVTMRVASPPVAGAACPAFPSISATWTIALMEQLIVPEGAALRFTRPLRFSLYRASDGRWYLGGKSWNVAAQRFNAIQPVAGPLLAYDQNPVKSGLVFTYRDGSGGVLSSDASPTEIASVTVIARAQSIRPTPATTSTHGRSHVDSAAVTIALRNSR